MSHLSHRKSYLGAAVQIQCNMSTATVYNSLEQVIMAYLSDASDESEENSAFSFAICLLDAL